MEQEYEKQLSQPKRPCDRCKEKSCQGEKLRKWSCKKYRSYLSRLKGYYTATGAKVEKPNCDECDFGFYNPHLLPVKCGRVIQPGKTVCSLAEKTVSGRACRGHRYPLTCPLAAGTSTCDECGSPIFPDEEPTCPSCRRKEKTKRSRKSEYVE